MRDIPVFTTSSGVASLVLKEIPYKKEAYIKIQDTIMPEALLEECCDFCRTAGAEHIYAAGHIALDKYPFHTAVWRMCRPRAGMPLTDACLFPVQEKTLEQWRMLYNEGMRCVPNSATMTPDDARRMLSTGDGYFIHRGDTLLGIGKGSAETIDAIVSVVPGAGQDVLLALCNALSDEQVILEVASENTRAVSLYRRLGFIRTSELSRWYQII